MCGLVVYCGNNKEKEHSLKKALDKINYRGPDHSSISLNENSIIGFNRLSIMGLTPEGNQPFKLKNNYLVCNGEIYNYKKLRLKKYKYKSNSDCEVLLPLLEENKYNIKRFFQKIDGEFALVSSFNDKIIAGRDHLGIRPLFKGRDSDNELWYASEAKSLIGICDKIEPVLPGTYEINGEPFYFEKSYEVHDKYIENELIAKLNIKQLLESAVKKRMKSDAPIGYLLSGGLDSSLVCAIAQKNSKTPIRTFAVGINKDPIDVKYAKIVADYIGSNHTEVLYTEEDIISHLKDLIYKIETWDVTTIRASIGMYLVCKYIKENTSIKVLMTGEVSDELFGYKYTDFAPNEEEFQKEAEKRIKELYLYDVLRADRCLASNSLEARVPFSDKDFVKTVMKVAPKLKMNTTGVGKHLLRKSFELSNYLPHEILYRDKAAFSDAVGHRSVDYLKEIAESKYTDTEFKNKVLNYKNNPPKTKEALFYREIFNEFFPNQEHLIPSYWLPNQEWENCNVDDPSARVLPNYGKSGD